MTDRNLYANEDAALFKSRAGHPYRPTSGTEGDGFYYNWCADCRRDEAFRKDPDSGFGCCILSAALAFNIGAAEYPKEWVYDEEGQPKCTAHEPMDGTTHDGRPGHA
ncbi:hypothetical protein [Oleispirillum naphthae]|uniref:hypothetical protein n=1 Tax=Oleispirillum naphthae TaxID=2838853 RepID=UPI0030822F72